MFDRYWLPWHVMIGDMVDYLLEDLEFPTVTIIDAHSFPDQPFPFESDQGPRPDICLGWDDYHTPHEYRRPLVALFESQGFSVEENRPYGGSFVPVRHHERRADVHSVMVEVNRRLYWDEGEGQVLLEGFERVRGALMEVMVLVDALRENFQELE
jgi:N-formylglutamate deformylase